MYRMLQEYEHSQALLLGRVQDIEAILHEAALQTEERETLEYRRMMLRTELSELLHTIMTLRERLGISTEGLDGRTRIGRSAGIRQGLYQEPDAGGIDEPGTNGHCPKGAA